MKEPKLNLALIPHLTCLNTIPEHAWKSLSTYWNTNSWFECQKFQTRCGQGLGIWILNNPPEWFLCGCSQSHTHFEKQSLCVDIIGHFLSLNTSLGCYDTFFPLVLWAFSVCCSPFSPSPARVNAPDSVLDLLPLRSVPMSPSTCSTPTRADGSQPCPSGASFLGRVTEQHEVLSEQWWTTAQALDKTVKQVTLILVPIAPHHPWSFLLPIRSLCFAAF